MKYVVGLGNSLILRKRNLGFGTSLCSCGAARYISQSPGELPQLHLWVMAATGPVDTTPGGAVKSWGVFPGPRVLCAGLAGTCLVEIVSALQHPVLWSKPAWWGASKLSPHLQCYKKEVLCFEHFVRVRSSPWLCILQQQKFSLLEASL